MPQVKLFPSWARWEFWTHQSFEAQLEPGLQAISRGIFSNILSPVFCINLYEELYLKKSKIMWKVPKEINFTQFSEVWDKKGSISCMFILLSFFAPLLL